MNGTIAEQLATDVGTAARRVSRSAPRGSEERLMQRWCENGDPSARDALIREFTPLAPPQAAPIALTRPAGGTSPPS